MMASKSMGRRPASADAMQNGYHYPNPRIHSGAAPETAGHPIFSSERDLGEASASSGHHAEAWC